MAEIETLIELVKAGELGKVRALLSANFLLASQRLASGESPLMAALYRGHHDIVDAVIEAGAEIDVFAAAATGRMGTCAAARPTRRSTPTPTTAGRRSTSRRSSAISTRPALLLDAGADVHAVSQNGLTNTPLHAATAGKHADVALLLIDHGADGHTVDSGGYTPLQIATQNGLVDVVKRLTAISR